jgi:heavy metal efflux system protein
VERLKEVRAAAVEVVQSTVFGQVIIIVYLPLLTFSGIEGKMLEPMALTVIIAFILSLTFMPAMIEVTRYSRPIFGHQNSSRP